MQNHCKKAKNRRQKCKLGGSKIENSIWSHFIFLKSCIKMGKQSQNSKAWLTPKSKTRFGVNRTRPTPARRTPPARHTAHPPARHARTPRRRATLRTTGRTHQRARAPVPPAQPHRQRAPTIANLGARSRKSIKKLNLNLTLLLSHDIWARDFKKALYVVGN